MIRVEELRLGLTFASAERAAEIERQIALIQSPAVAVESSVEPQESASEPALHGDRPADWPDFPADADWRERRRLLRLAGIEVKQFDGALYVDGRHCADPRLLPPGTPT